MDARNPRGQQPIVLEGDVKFEVAERTAPIPLVSLLVTSKDGGFVVNFTPQTAREVAACMREYADAIERKRN